MNTNRPDPLRCAALVLLSLCCAAFLIELNSSTPWPSTDPSAFLDWWERHGTATAAITLLRIVGTTLAGLGDIHRHRWIVGVHPSKRPVARRLASYNAELVQTDPRRQRYHDHACRAHGRQRQHSRRPSTHRVRGSWAAGGLKAKHRGSKVHTCADRPRTSHSRNVKRTQCRDHAPLLRYDSLQTRRLRGCLCRRRLPRHLGCTALDRYRGGPPLENRYENPTRSGLRG